jgi:hypothetical protein
VQKTEIVVLRELRMDIQDDLGDVFLRESQYNSNFDVYIAELLGVSSCTANCVPRMFGTFPNYYAYGNLGGDHKKLAHMATFWVFALHLYPLDVVTIQCDYTVTELYNGQRREYVLYPYAETIDLYSLHPPPQIKLYLNGERYAIRPCGWVLSNEMVEKLCRD